jgi:D-glycero-D-manno-heptose 1,7-bisphosphate phosphatase
MAKKRLIILDRDGVINELRHPYVSHASDFQFIKGVIPALQEIYHSGIAISICSNQRGVSRGLVSADTLDEIECIIEDSLQSNVKSIDFHYCTHSIEAKCECRKPMPGMLLDALKNHRVKCSEAIFVGDNISDFVAAQNANIDFSLVLTGHGKTVSKSIPSYVKRYKNLHSFVKDNIIKIDL